MGISTLLSNTDSMLPVIGAGLIVHLVFKKTETTEPLKVVPLVFGVPALLTKLYAGNSASQLSTAFSVFTLFWASILTSITVYRLSPWHPLASYPGPLICKLTKFHIAFMSLGGKQYLYYARLHEKYGDAVRIGPNEVSICNVDAVQPMLGNNGIPKGAFWDGRIPEAEAVKPLIAIRDKTEHTRRRRPWTRAFNTAALKGYEELVLKRATQLVDTMAARHDSFDLSRLISFFAYDIMSDLAFGGGSEMMADGDKSGLWHLLEAGQKNAIFMGQVPWLGRIFLKYPKFASDLKAFRMHARSRAVIRNKNGSPHKDIFHHLMDEDGVAMQRPSIVEVVSDGGLAIIAGSDTTSSTISHLFYFLMTNPIAYKRLQDEIDDLGDDIYDCTKQAHLPYLNAAINEALRLLPPVLVGSHREPEKGSGGKMLGSYFLPEGNSTFIPTYSLQRDPRCFSPLPDTFLPERWLPETMRKDMEPKIFSSKEGYIHNTTAFIPFSLGPTSCAGKNLAYLEMRMTVVLMIHRLNFTLQKGYDADRWETDMMDHFVTKKGTLPTVVTVRNH
ncbi:hypothetical protein D9619_004468 [Psilocybe cf. subviscida]|uniref:High nitrogen upregulated cytochrome P450 monooxygenase 2 n=1 Tax=Psilocybe cf. subviscida TaxID=2480587 RepID=A0A8H5F8F4_9AGAR|nr:hypothetical protein D9619_004468 [Psilocybe cf. subviscida]